MYEETGYDCSALIDPNEYIEGVINFQYTRLYIVKNVPMDTVFVPRTRKEIKSCDWYCLEYLPTHKLDTTCKTNLGVNANSFFMIMPFVKRLKRWMTEPVTKKTAFKSIVPSKRTRHKSTGDLENGFIAKSVPIYKNGTYIPVHKPIAILAKPPNVATPTVVPIVVAPKAATIPKREKSKPNFKRQLFTAAQTNSAKNAVPEAAVTNSTKPLAMKVVFEDLASALTHIDLTIRQLNGELKPAPAVSLEPYKRKYKTISDATKHPSTEREDESNKTQKQPLNTNNKCKPKVSSLAKDTSQTKFTFDELVKFDQNIQRWNSFSFNLSEILPTLASTRSSEPV